MTGPQTGTRVGVPTPRITLDAEASRHLAERLAAGHAGQGWRAEPRQRKIQYAQRVGLAVALDAPPDDVDHALERVLGADDLLPAHWLATGAKLADAVALLRAPAGTATGFLVSPWLLMTNHHVLESPTEAAATEAVFRYQQDTRGRITRARTCALDPDRFFLTDTDLDVAVVALAGPDQDAGLGHTFGSLRLVGATGKILLGQPVNIIQHPAGRPREIAVRNNLLLTLTTTHLIYATDTAKGSSGAPVLNDRWELVALHHRSVEATNAAGQTVDLNGNPTTVDTPQSERHWIANQGVRVSALVAWLAHASSALPHPQQALLEQLLNAGRDRPPQTSGPGGAAARREAVDPTGTGGTR